MTNWTRKIQMKKSTFNWNKNVTKLDRCIAEQLLMLQQFKRRRETIESRILDLSAEINCINEDAELLDEQIKFCENALTRLYERKIAELGDTDEPGDV